MSHKDTLLGVMREARAQLDAAVAEAMPRLEEPVAGGWRVRDELAHLALWERVAARKIAGAPLPDGEDLIEREPWDIDAFNDEMTARWRLRSTSYVLTEFAAAHEALVAAVQQADDADCAHDGTVWRAIAADGAGHYDGHFPVPNLMEQRYPPRGED
jgi:mycothiol maleylpyruvate isomerase-like protein